MFLRCHFNGCRSVHAVLLGLVISAASIAQCEPGFNSKTAGFTLQGSVLVLGSTIEINVPINTNKAIGPNFFMALMFAVEGLKYNEYGFERGGGGLL